MSTSRPSHHANDFGTSFQNPWPQPKSVLASGQVFAKFPFEWARSFLDHPSKPCEVVNPDFGRHAPDEGVLKATWLGHAGFMLQLPFIPDGSGEPLRILFDPIWSDRASPSQLAGPKRRLPPPCSLRELPEFHFIVTSHNHYDHLDIPTIQEICRLRGPHVQYIVPLGNKPLFLSIGIRDDQITELDWWDEIDLGKRTPIKNRNSAPSDAKFICTPAQHASGRGFSDQRAALWASWVVRQKIGDTVVSVYHAGDTGYMTQTGPCPAFAEIGTRYGPFDLAMLPIWRGASLSFVASMGLRLASTDIIDGLHASPAQAVALHKDIRSRHSLGMHFATFAGSDVEAFEPIVELIDAKEKENIGEWHEEGGFSTIAVGATAILPITPTAKSQLGLEVSPAAA